MKRPRRPRDTREVLSGDREVSGDVEQRFSRRLVGSSCRGLSQKVCQEVHRYQEMLYRDLSCEEVLQRVLVKRSLIEVLARGPEIPGDQEIRRSCRGTSHF